jgi:four helix bundle protein
MAAQYDLEERTYLFAKSIRRFVKELPRTICHRCDVPQVVRSSGSVAANYIEANEALSKKDFLMRIKISRKEAKETILWLRLLDPPPGAIDEHRNVLLTEAPEIMKILGAIFRRSEDK